MSGGLVAIVDDNPSILDTLKFVLELHGYHVLAYSSAMSFLMRPAAQLACLIIDQTLPGMTGLELVAQLRREGDALPVLLTTGLPLAELVANALLLDIETFRQKPVELEDILEFVGKHA